MSSDDDAMTLAELQRRLTEIVDHLASHGYDTAAIPVYMLAGPDWLSVPVREIWHSPRRTPMAMRVVLDDANPAREIVFSDDPAPTIDVDREGG